MRHPLMIAAVLGTMGAIAFAQAPAQPAAKPAAAGGTVQAHADIKGEGITGEVYISVDRVKENAKSQGEPVKSELLRVIFHGALHLCGYDDKTPAEKSRMRKKKKQYIHVPRDTVSH